MKTLNITPPQANARLKNQNAICHVSSNVGIPNEMQNQPLLSKRVKFLILHMHGQKLTYQIQPRTHHAQKFPLRISVFYLLYFASGCNGQHDIINANDNLSFGGLFHPTPSSRAPFSRTYAIFFFKIVCDKTSVATNQARGTNEANTSKCWCWTSEKGDGERFMLRKSGI